MAKGNQIIEKMPNWAVGVISVITVGAIAFVGWKVYRKAKIAKENKSNQQEADDANKELRALEKSGETLSYPKANYAATANSIAKLLNGCETFGSEIQVIEEIIKVVKKPIDWWNLVKEFGKRDIADCVYGKSNYGLIGLLKDQLDSSGFYSINKNGYKASGMALNSLNVLSDFLQTKGISI